MDFNEAKLAPLIDVRFVLGLKSNFKKVTLERYDKLLKATRATIKDFLENGSTRVKEKPRDPLTYEEMKEAFSKQLDPERVAAVVDNYGEPIEGAAVFLAEDITNIFDAMPVNELKTLWGVEATDPSSYEISVWLNKIAVFFYPMDVLRHFKDGSLSLGEVENLKTIYPEYYSDIQRIAFEELVEKKDGELSLKDNRTLSTLIGVQRLSPYLITEIQKMLTASQKQDETAANNNAKITDNLPTEVQKSLG